MSCEQYRGVARPIDAFIKYFLDVKPYHTKILEVLESYRFNEDVVVNIDENMRSKIEIANDPLCKVTGWGVDWDDDCGFSSISCCDLFDCIGGYGLIYDNSTLVTQAPIISSDSVQDKIIVPGNKSRDSKFQIESIVSNEVCVISGDHTDYLKRGAIFLVIPKNTIPITAVLEDGFEISGNRMSDFILRGNFIVYNSMGNDYSYSVKEAFFDFARNTTVITVNEPLNNPNVGNGMIEISSSNKNNGVYQVESSTTNGITTTIRINKSVRMFTILDDKVHGSIQIRDAFIGPRILTLKKGDIEKEFRILQSVYDFGSNTTEVAFTRPIRDDFLDGTASLYGYMTHPGFDADQECSTPGVFNVHTMVSEHLKIQVLGESIGIPPPVQS